MTYTLINICYLLDEYVKIRFYLRVLQMPVINSNAFKKKHDIPVSQSLSMKEIAKLSGMPIKALNEVYDKGMGAYYSNPGSVKPMVASPEQWAMGRVYSFVMRRKTTFGKADKSIAEKYKIV